MGNKPKKHRIRFPSNPRVWKVPVNASKTSAGGFSREISVGDLIALYTTGSGPLGLTAGVAYPFSVIANASISDASDKFLGIAKQNSLNTQSKEIIVAVDGVFEYPCSGAAHTVGQFVTAVAGTTSIESASVGVSATTGHDLGRVCEAAKSGGDTVVTFEIKSKIAGESG
jgi:hypothetical protein